MNNKLRYIIALISDISQKIGLTEPQTYKYLKTCGALSFLDKHFDILHTFSFEENIDNILTYCKKYKEQQ